MPAKTTQAMQAAAETQDLGSGVVRNGKGYIIDGEEVKGIMLRWKRFRSRIEAMEREAGFMINKKGHRVSVKKYNHLKRSGAEAGLSVEDNVEEQRESETDSGSHDEESEEAEEAKKKSPPKPKKAPAKRPRVK